MQTQIKIHDYKLCGFGNAWAYITIFGHDLNLEFTKYDAITAAIELGFMEEPTDRDEKRVGYEKTAFSAVVREVWPWEQRVQYQENDAYLFEFGGSIQGEQIITRLALQSSEVREVVQAEATSIACCDCPANIIDPKEIEKWMIVNDHLFEYLPDSKSHTSVKLVNWEHVSQHKIASLRTENKLLVKLI